MIFVRFRNSEHHSDVMKKIKKMKKFVEELEDCLEETVEREEAEYRDDRHYGRHKSYDEDDEEMYEHSSGRYGYRGGSRRM